MQVEAISKIYSYFGLNNLSNSGKAAVYTIAIAILGATLITISPIEIKAKVIIATCTLGALVIALFVKRFFMQPSSVSAPDLEFFNSIFSQISNSECKEHIDHYMTSQTIGKYEYESVKLFYEVLSDGEIFYGEYIINKSEDSFYHQNNLIKKLTQKLTFKSRIAGNAKYAWLLAFKRSDGFFNYEMSAYENKKRRLSLKETSCLSSKFTNNVNICSIQENLRNFLPLLSSTSKTLLIF